MIFGESANTNKTEYTATIKIADPKYSMPRWCHKINTVPKAKITAIKSKREPRKGGGKDIQ
jgi:hypothetical protein